MKNNIEQLAAAADVQVSPVSMPPTRPCSRPQKVFFAKTKEGRLLNGGQSMTGKELTEWLKARVTRTDSENDQGVENDWLGKNTPGTL